LSRPQGALTGLLAAAVMALPAYAVAPPTSPQKVTGPEISMLIRATIVALHQANLTANYSVLHDLGDNQFQAAYSQSALSDMFRSFRAQGVNLEPAVLYDAELDAPPKLTTDGLLRVVGHFATAPQQIIFDMTFRSQGGMWRLDALNAGMRPAPVALAPAAPQQATGQPQIQPVASRAPVPLSPPARRAVPQMAGVVDVGAQNQPSFE